MSFAAVASSSRGYFVSVVVEIIAFLVLSFFLNLTLSFDVAVSIHLFSVFDSCFLELCYRYYNSTTCNNRRALVVLLSVSFLVNLYDNFLKKNS